MRWKDKPPKLKPDDVRTRHPLALIPTLIGDTWVWLERYEVEEVYRVVDRTRYTGNSKPYTYSEAKWVPRTYRVWDPPAAMS